MNFFPFLHFFNALVYVYLGSYILIKNPKALLNRICAAFLFCFALWSFSMVFIHNIHSSQQAAMLFLNISAIGWVGFGSFFVWFILAFTGQKEWLKKIWLYLLFAPPLLFIYLQWTGLIFDHLKREFFGWKSVFSKSVWPYFFAIYCFAYIGLGLYFLFHFIKNTPNNVKKRQANLIFMTVLLTLALGSVTDIFLPLLDIHNIPNLADTFVLIWAFGVVYAMAKYSFLMITPASAADNIISTMHDALFLLDLEGNIVLANKAANDLLGYEEGELRGVPMPALLPGNEQTTFVKEKINRQEDVKDKEVLFRTKGGKEFPVLFSGSVLRDEGGAEAGMVVVAKDISERKKMEDELLGSKKLEYLGIIAGGIAHDFNNILSIILGNASLAQLEVTPKDKVFRYLAELEKATLKAGELTRKFLTLSRGGWLNRKKIALNEILTHALDSDPELEKDSITYDIDIPQDIMSINGDEHQLSQVFQNLFRNAVEAIPPGKNGNIAIKAENIIIKEVMESSPGDKSPLKKGHYIKVTVEDNGIGIPWENIEKVLDPYFSTKDDVAQKGLGLGLTICHAVVKKHGGHIRVDSPPGKGTLVTLHLPAFYEPPLAGGT